MRSTSRSPTMPVDERDWLPSRVVNGSDDDEMTTRRPAPQRLAPTLPQTPPTVIPKPTWIPQFHTIMIPPLTSSIDLASHHHKRTSNPTRATPSFSFATHGGTLGSTHIWASPPSKPPYPPFPMAPTSNHSNPRSPPRFSRSCSPSSSSPLLHAHKRPRTTRRRSLSSGGFRYRHGQPRGW
ncbi:hypothetical protein BGW80DRAFT_817000 [Lactifluus volemus]|nr:hypothetical protein BGW80DRAFT_817000 [Lactifluus volemus]